MPTLTAICVISFIGIFLMLAWIMRKMAKLKKQNDLIYEAKLRENRFMKECKRIAEEEDIPYDFEFEEEMNEIDKIQWNE